MIDEHFFPVALSNHWPISSNREAVEINGKKYLGIINECFSLGRIVKVNHFFESGSHFRKAKALGKIMDDSTPYNLSTVKPQH